MERNHKPLMIEGDSQFAVQHRDLSNHELLAVLYHDPNSAHLLEKVRLEGSEKEKGLEQFWAWFTESKFLYIFLADPKSFHGTAYISPTLKQDAKTTANVVSASNLTDFVTNWPLLFYAFSSFLGLAGALLASGILNVGILKFGNEVAAGAARSRPQNRAWSKWSTVGLLALNIVQSLASGVGTELFNNQSALSQQKALHLIEERIAQVDLLATLDNPQYNRVKTRCEAQRQVLNTIERSHPRWNSLYVELYGTYGEKDKDWTQESLENLPLCRQVTRLEKEAYNAHETAKATLESGLIERVRIGNDVVFIKQFYPDVYTQTFTETGELKSGVEAVQYATDNFFGSLYRGQLSQIGFSLFFFSVSVITSAAACLMTIAYAQREDVQMSWDERVRRERDRWLYQQWQSLLDQKRQ